MTTSYWRGVSRRADRRFVRGRLRRACTWLPSGPADAVGEWAPTLSPPSPIGYCDFCVAYWSDLVRMKVRVYQ